MQSVQLCLFRVERRCLHRRSLPAAFYPVYHRKSSMRSVVHTRSTTDLLFQVNRWAHWQLVLQHHKAKHACRRRGSIKKWLHHRRRYSQGEDVSGTTDLTLLLASSGYLEGHQHSDSILFQKSYSRCYAGCPHKDCSSVGCGPEQGSCTTSQLP